MGHMTLQQYCTALNTRILQWSIFECVLQGDPGADGLSLSGPPGPPGPPGPAVSFQDVSGHKPTPADTL